MSERIRIHDFVSNHQSGEGKSLRRLLNDREMDFDVVELDEQPLKLGKDLFLWEVKDELPEVLPDGVYVIIDTIYFSTTSLVALIEGAHQLKVECCHEDALENEGVLIGGESKRKHTEVRDGFDFFNSPTNVSSMPVEGEKLALTSHNGAVAAVKVAEATPDSAEIVLGTTMNARAIGEYLRSSDKPVNIVSSGSRGSHVAEDHIAAYLMVRYMHNDPLDSDELEKVVEMLEEQQRYLYDEEIPEIRLNDMELITDINSVDMVPKLYKEGPGWVFRRD